MAKGLEGIAEKLMSDLEIMVRDLMSGGFTEEQARSIISMIYRIKLN